MSNSYSAIENDLRHRFRDDLNRAEKPRDIENIFSFTIRSLLINIFNDTLRFTDDDIRLLPSEAQGYQLAEAITSTPEYTKASTDSDLLSIIGRFAESASNRHKSLSQQEERIHAQLHTQH